MQSRAIIEQEPISLETIHDLVGSAMNIPSVALGQPTQFVVLNEIDALSKASEIVPLHPLTTRALAAIIVCGDIEKAEIKDKWVLDCETASQQILLTAHAKGFGAHISPIYPDSDRMYNMTVLLDLPKNIVAHSYVAMGYPAKIARFNEVFDNDRVHYNSWTQNR
jgi:nitroreductase